MTPKAIADLGKYHILEKLGEGGFGVVYKATDTTLDRTVAIKVIAPEFLRDPEFVERFRREAWAAARLTSPNIVSVLEVGESEGVHYLAMQYVGGSNLSQMIKQQGALPLDRVASITTQIASALDDAHEEGLIHRDVKPGNILVDGKGRAFLSDFGLVKAASGSAMSGMSTTGGRIVGTPEYMSPEQALGHPVDKTTDVYSLGVVAFEMLTGRIPFSAESTVAVLHMQAYEPPPHLHDFRPDLAAEIDAVIQRCLSKEPAQRDATAGRFAAALGDAIRVHGERARAAYYAQTVAEIKARIGSDDWAAAVEQATDLPKQFPDDAALAPLLAEAQAGLQKQQAEDEQQRQMADLRDHAKQSMAAGAWEQAVASLRKLVEMDAAYPEAGDLLEQAEEGQAKAIAEQNRLQVVAVLGEQAAFLVEKKWWQGAEDVLAALTEVDPGNTEAAAQLDMVRRKRQQSSLAVQRLVGQRNASDWRAAVEQLLAAQNDDPLIAVEAETKAVYNQLGDWLKGVRSALARETEAVTQGQTASRRKRVVAPSDSAPPVAVSTIAVAPRRNWRKIELAEVQKLVKGRYGLGGFVLDSLKGHSKVCSIAISPHGDYLAAGSDDGEIALYSMEAGRATERAHFQTYEGDAVYLTFSPDGTMLAIGSGSGDLSFWETPEGIHLPPKQGHQRQINCLSFHPCERRLASASGDGSVCIWDVDGKETPVTLIDRQSSSMLGVAYSPDGEFLATSGDTPHIQLWSPVTHSILFDIDTGADSIFDITFSPGRETLAALTSNDQICLWSVTDSSPVRTLSGMADGARVVFSSDGLCLAAASKNNTVAIWDINSGKQIASLAGHTATVNDVVFFPETPMLASGSSDGTVRLWGEV